MNQSAGDPPGELGALGLWWAAIGPRPTMEPAGPITTPHDCARRLGDEEHVGPLVLRSAPERLIEYQRTVGGWSQLVTWPILVEGIPGETDWNRVEAQACGELQRLAGLLSVAWNEPWRLRSGPRLSSQVPPSALECDPNPLPFPWNETQTQMEPENCPLPSWLREAWDLLDSDQGGEIEAALGMWHQGILLTPEHPSMAFVAFISSIETLATWLERRGAIHVDATPCIHCGNVPRAAARFWAAVERGVQPEDLASLRGGDVYRLRSLTAHRGTLHGIEQRFGSPIYFPIDPEDPVQEFNLITLMLMRKASRHLLLDTLDSSREDAL